jgi:galactokinase
MGFGLVRGRVTDPKVRNPKSGIQNPKSRLQMARELSFADKYNRDPAVLVRSPGRVNLIGEHTDYNLGYVLPVAIDRYTKLAAAPRRDRTLRVYSDTVGEEVEIGLDGHLGLVGESSHWANYVRGAAKWLRDNDAAQSGADVLIWGDLPVGVGLSSSASFLVGILSTLTSLAGRNLSKPDLAQAAQSVENDFIGVPVGIMDQTAITQAEERAALLIDCRSLETTPVPLNLAAMGLSLVVVNSGMTRDLADSQYARRKRECEAAVGALKVITYDLNLNSLRDVSPEMLSKHGSKLYHTLYKRARHVVTENERVLQTVSALAEGNVGEVGRLMNESHESLRSDYEVSNMFMDRLVELSQGAEGVVGARLTGAGFGGCTVNLVQSSELRSFDRNVVRRYAEETSLTPEMYVVKPVGGIEVQNL